MRFLATILLLLQLGTANAAETVEVVISGADAVAIDGAASSGRDLAGERLRARIAAGARAARVRLLPPMADDGEAQRAWLTGLGFSEVAITEPPSEAPCGCLPDGMNPPRNLPLDADVVP